MTYWLITPQLQNVLCLARTSARVKTPAWRYGVQSICKPRSKHNLIAMPGRSSALVAAGHFVLAHLRKAKIVHLGLLLLHDRLVCKETEQWQLLDFRDHLQAISWLCLRSIRPVILDR